MFPPFESLLASLSQAEVYESHDADISDLFGVPSMVTFNGAMDHDEYKADISNKVREFQHQLSTHLETLPSQASRVQLLSEIHFELSEIHQDFFQKSIGKKDQLITIPANRNVKYTWYGEDAPPPIIEVRVARFVRTQQAAVERLIRYAEHKINLIHASANLIESDQRTEFFFNLNQLNSADRLLENGQETVPTQKVQWNGGRKEFVQLFAELIKTGKLGLGPDNTSDTEPIVRLLHSWFYIPKSKGEGEISAGTLSTYFKKFNSGEEF